jgi:hypothetical protein
MSRYVVHIEIASILHVRVRVRGTTCSSRESASTDCASSRPSHGEYQRVPHGPGASAAPLLAWTTSEFSEDSSLLQSVFSHLQGGGTKAQSVSQ